MEKIGKYEIREKIGVGGFGAVYLGYDPFIKRKVAVKTCSSDDASIRERFFQEAEIAGNLHHRNVTTVYDFGLHGDLPYLVQEYLSGEDLGHKIKRRDFLPFAEKLHYLLQIARGLDHAHTAGVVHRDIKPANVRILEDGTAKIMDFGIAKLIQQESGLTQTGMTLGTAAYLAPEQIRGERVGPSTDVFSFGVLAYELLTNERPFAGEQISAVLFQILHREPRPIRDLRPDCPGEMITLVERCLEKDPESRYADGKALLTGLEEVQRERRKRRESGEDDLARGTGKSDFSKARTKPMPSPAAAGRATDGEVAAAGQAVSHTLAARDAVLQDTVRQDVLPQGTTPRDALPQDTLPHLGVPQTTRPLATSGVPAAPGPPPGSGSQRLDQLELAGAPAAPPAASTTQIAAVAKSEGKDWRKLGLAAAAIVLVAAVIAGGWWLGNRGELAGAVEAAPSAVETAVAPAGSGGEEAPGGEPAAAAGEAEAAETATALEPGATALTSTAPTSTAPAATPPPPPPPAPATVSVPAVAWAGDAMTVRLGGGPRLSLGRARTFTDLEPGSYDLSFRLELEGYRAEADRRVELAGGQRLEVTSPIPEPGLLTARARLRKLQGEVSIDGEAVGPTPFAGHRLAPGEHRLEIRPLAGELEPIVESLDVPPGQEVVVTFDLQANDERITVRLKDREPR